MKRTILFGLSCLLLVATLGCGEDVAPAPAPVPEPDDSPLPEEVYTCGSIESVPQTGVRATHVPIGDEVDYVTNPPCIGNHYGQWVEWGVYETPLRPEFFVHNMEHGGLTYLYNCPEGCPDLLASLTALVTSYPPDDGGDFRYILAPDTGLPTKLAVAAWGHAYTADEFCEEDLDTFKRFHYRDAPEDIARPGIRPGEEHDPHNNEPAPPSQRFVMIQDTTVEPTGARPGADIDAITLRKADGTEISALAISEGSLVDCTDNAACDTQAALGAPDIIDAETGACIDPAEDPEATPAHISLNRGFVIASFGDAILENGDVIIVHEIDSLQCPTFEDDAYTVSMGSADTDTEGFTPLSEGAAPGEFEIRGL